MIDTPVHTRPLRIAGLLLLTLAVIGLGACSRGQNQGEFSRTQIRIVGSSTVFPFSAYIAEELGVTTDIRTPVVEATGTGGGMQMFCAGTAEHTPDIVNASRRMKPAELKMCRDHGVNKVTEIMFGYDGVVLVRNDSLPTLNLSLQQLTLAVAAKVPKNGQLVPNPYDYWDEIDPSLPHREILIYGPPTSSGTRDAFEKLVMARATQDMPVYDGAYTTIRRDGAYVPSGENDNLIVQKVAQNKTAIGIVGFPFLTENRSLIEAVTINGIKPTPATISSGQYPIARSLFFYVKLGHVGKVPGISQYVLLFLSDRMSGPRGVLNTLGLIHLPDEKREQMRQRWKQRQQVTLATLKK